MCDGHHCRRKLPWSAGVLSPGRCPAALSLITLLALLALLGPAGASARQWHGPVAHIAGGVPDDPGRGSTPFGWQAIQWNFVGPFGVNAQEAWNNLADGRPLRRQGRRSSPSSTPAWPTPTAGASGARRTSTAAQFVARLRLRRPRPLRRRPAGPRHPRGLTIAEATNNGFGLTGLAFGARIMPVRVLDTQRRGRRRDHRPRRPLRGPPRRPGHQPVARVLQRRDRRAASPR